MNPKYSIVIPFYNERQSLTELYQRLVKAVEPLGPFEMIFVDDGSTDGSFEVVRQLFTQDQRVRALQLRKNFGKSAGLAVGFKAAGGEIVATIDADLQDEPAEIQKLVMALDHHDLVTGWKEHRHDPWTKTFPSWVFNSVLARTLFGVKLHDLNSGLKVMRREVADSLDLYGEHHRFIPILASLNGFRVSEVPVVHHQRKYGQSKYGWNRFFRGAFDLLTIAFLARFQHRPLHLFGGIGAVFTIAGLAVLVYLSVLRFQGQTIGNRPLLTFGVLGVLTGLQFVFTGLLAELITSRSTERHYSTRTELDHDREHNR
ncbi:MAG: glycosyltransferase family 2 protein [Candidatus Kerfeldbacteria bacterium]|nr:glycosyltransferase family 2 protein [Candidatus Kerfeldbacteria bacterium]